MEKSPKLDLTMLKRHERQNQTPLFRLEEQDTLISDECVSLLESAAKQRAKTRQLTKRRNSKQPSNTTGTAGEVVYALPLSHEVNEKFMQS